MHVNASRDAIGKQKWNNSILITSGSMQSQFNNEDCCLLFFFYFIAVMAGKEAHFRMIHTWNETDMELL